MSITNIGQGQLDFGGRNEQMGRECQYQSPYSFRYYPVTIQIPMPEGERSGQAARKST